MAAALRTKPQRMTWTPDSSARTLFNSARITRPGVQQRTDGTDNVTMDNSSTHGRPRDEVAMALHLSRGFDTREAVTIGCRFVALTDAETAEVLDIWTSRQTPHPGRACSPDCAEYGCSTWTACDPR